MEYSESTSSQSQNLSTRQSEYSSMLQNYELLTCDIHKEWINHLSEICIKKDCQNIFKITCIDCIRKEYSEKNHSLNDFISFKRFVSKLNQLSQSTPQCQKYSDILKPALDSLNKQAKELLIKIDQLRVQLQQIIQDVAKLVGDQQDYTKKQQDELEIIRSKQSDFYKLKQKNELDEYLKQMSQLVVVKKVNGSNFNLELQCADQENNENEVRIAQNQKRCDKSSKVLIEIDAQIMDIINKLKNYNLNFTDELFGPRLEFSEKLKHPNIKLIQKDIIQQTGSNQNSFFFSESKLPMNQDSTWAFKITQSNNYIMVGVAHPEIIQQQNFTYSSWSQLNGGFYFLYGSGFTLAHYKKEENNVDCNLAFKAGDIIYILFQPIKKKIYFCKNKTKPYVSITLSPDREDYQPCLKLYSQNDSVQMLKNDENKFDL